MKKILTNFSRYYPCLSRLAPACPQHNIRRCCVLNSVPQKDSSVNIVLASQPWGLSSVLSTYVPFQRRVWWHTYINMNTYTQSHVKARHVGMVAHVYNPGLGGIWLLRPPELHIESKSLTQTANQKVTLQCQCALVSGDLLGKWIFGGAINLR